MKVKRYRAEDRATALKQIRAELGADAVIVAENRVRTGGVFGMFNRFVDRETARYGRGTAAFIRKSGGHRRRRSDGACGPGAA